ncbi:MAG: OmpH family outer membrane protein, partial [Myxococcota bacterium]
GVAAFLAVTTSSADAGLKIGVVNLQAALLQTEEGRNASNTMKRYMERRQGDLNRRQKRLAREEEELRRQAGFLSRASFQRRYEHYQQRMLKTQNKFVDYNKQLQQKQAQMLGPMTQKMVAVVTKVATAGGYDLVIDQSAVPYARGDLNLTDLVVQRYNSAAGK